MIKYDHNYYNNDTRGQKVRLTDLKRRKIEKGFREYSANCSAEYIFRKCLLIWILKSENTVHENSNAKERDERLYCYKTNLLKGCLFLGCDACAFLSWTCNV